MSYLEEFRVQIQNRDFSKFWQLWEEYCTSDTVDVDEFVQILQAVKGSDLAKQLGPYIETALPLWETIKDPADSYRVFKYFIDLQTTNSPKLADLSTQLLRDKYGELPHFNEWLRLVGLRSRDQFQEAVTNFDLLAHMKKGKFVYHTGGWGAGEIIDLSPIREQLTVEFEKYRATSISRLLTPLKILCLSTTIAFWLFVLPIPTSWNKMLGKIRSGSLNSF